MNTRIVTFQDIIMGNQKYLDRYSTDVIFHATIEALRHSEFTKELVIDLVYDLCVANEQSKTRGLIR